MLIAFENGIEELEDELLLFTREEFDLLELSLELRLRAGFGSRGENFPSGKGKLAKVSSSVSTTDYIAFDILGRVTRSKQTTDGVVYGDDSNPMTYTYNLSGALIEQKYPSGRVVKNVLDNDGDLALVQSKKNQNFGYFNYAKNFTYTAAGAVSSMQLGNGKWESTQFNSRLQPTQIGLGSSATSQNLLKLNYNYGTADNNGNVKSQTITVPTVGANPGFTATQNYTYDPLNRLLQATETVPNQTGWNQTFTFDRYGNRNFNEGPTTTLSKLCTNNTTVCPETVPVVNPSVNTANNRLNGYTFDTSGNTTRDAENRKFTYDGENKQVKVETVNAGGTVTGTIGEYWYDGDGKRVKKVGYANNQPTETVIFAYDAGGKLIAEYANQISQTPQVSYLTSDHLGSPRINTDATGAVIARHDYHPFGEEIIGTGGRTPGLGYGEDDVRKKFTSYERDIESDLDYAINRYHSASLGRFTQVDPYNIIFEKEKGKDEKEKYQIFIAYISEPQIWNKYVYSVNNPINLSDPDGRRPVTAAEQDNLRRFRESGYAYSVEQLNAGEWTAQQAEAFRHSVDAASSVIENAILAVADSAKEDPKNLQAVLYAMGQIGETKFSNSGTVGFNSNGANVKLGPGSNKCTIFVGIAYSKGANIGWLNNGNNKGYQVNFSWSGNVYTPVANDLVTSGAANFVAVANPQLGDIAAGRGTANVGRVYNTYNTGHAGLFILGDVVISANQDHGVRVGSFSPTSSANTGFQYRRYKP